MDEHRDLWWESPTRELGKVVHLDLPEPFRAVHGGTLSRIQVSYESWGELNAAGDNAVLIVHPMTTDCHVTGEFADTELGWWEGLIGPGRAIDTDRRFVICPNIIGGCYGTTGPRFPADDGEPYHDRFPLLTPLDMMRVQHRFIRALGIEKLFRVVGPSMGGMVAWEWAIEAPEAVDQVVVVAAPVRTTAHQIGLNWLQRRGIELDMDGNEFASRQGQMIARGVGMLSYRSPVGLDEKFGRDWFKKPGSTLRDRGMFNVESWLRHHGLRITKRFDPYTYLLYSRAMDLHDVAAGRDDLVAALDRVRCRVLLVAISTDYLYPPDEVHLGADILDHLGRDVQFAEIRSPHGHDACFLEIDQLTAILREHERPHPSSVPSREERRVRTVRAGILGAGRVAASFVRLAADRRAQLAEQHGIAIEIAAVADVDPARGGDPAFEGIEFTTEPDRLVERDDLDVVLELTRGTEVYPLVERTLSRRRPVVSSNKPLIRAHGSKLERLAFQKGVRLAYHDSIAAGWPLLFALERPLARGRITCLQSVLSGACNVILENMVEGADLEEAIADAVKRGITEPDPELDVSGWDTAQKLTILLTRAVGLRYTPEEIEVIGLRGIDPALVRAAEKRELRVKLVGLCEWGPELLQATVRPVAVPAESHLGSVRGENHVVVLRTRETGEMVYFGEGAGTLPVATAVLNDLLGVFDPGHSWTGRFPPAVEKTQAPSFDRHLVLEKGRARVVTEAAEGSVPVLDLCDGAGTNREPEPS